MEGKTKTAAEIISPHVICSYDNDNDSSDLPEGDYIEESKCLEAMEIYAKQESEKAVREFRIRLLHQLPNPKSSLESFYKSEIIELIEKLK